MCIRDRSYTTFSIGAPRVVATAIAGETVGVEVEVTNTGERRGSEVVQVYVEPVAPAMVRPRRELKGFAKVRLEPGESTTVAIELDARAFAYFDPADADWDRVSALSIVPAEGGGLHRTAAGWWVDPGEYGIAVGRSSRHEAGRATLTLTGDPVRLAV